MKGFFFFALHFNLSIKSLSTQVCNYSRLYNWSSRCAGLVFVLFHDFMGWVGRMRSLMDIADVKRI